MVDQPANSQTTADDGDFICEGCGAVVIGDPHYLLGEQIAYCADCFIQEAAMSEDQPARSQTTGNSMNTAPRDRHIMARGIPAKRSGKVAGEYVLGDEIVAEVYYEPAVSFEQGPALHERWAIFSPSEWSFLVEAKEWWPL